MQLRRRERSDENPARRKAASSMQISCTPEIQPCAGGGHTAKQQPQPANDKQALCWLVDQCVATMQRNGFQQEKHRAEKCDLRGVRMPAHADRKSAVWGKSWSERVDLGGRG